MITTINEENRNDTNEIIIKNKAKFTNQKVKR